VRQKLAQQLVICKEALHQVKSSQERPRHAVPRPPHAPPLPFDAAPRPGAPAPRHSLDVLLVGAVSGTGREQQVPQESAV